MAANPEAIAWYVQRSERLLDDLRERIQALRARGVQLAGFSGAVLALAGANVESTLSTFDGLARYGAGSALLIGFCLLIAAFVSALRPRAVSVLSGEEVLNYSSDRFVEEPDLWRVHLRTIRGLSDSIQRTTYQGDQAAETIARAELLLVFGLATVGIALVILAVVATF